MSVKTNPIKIGVIGGGSWGSALALVLARAGHNVHLWDQSEELLEAMRKDRSNQRYLPDIPFPKNIFMDATLPETIREASVILIAVPSHAFENALQVLKPLMTDNQSVVWATKGVDAKTGDFLHSVFEKIFGKKHLYGVLSGPSFAKEVALGLPTAVAIASKEISFAKKLAEIFSHDSFLVEVTDDVMGVQFGGLVKNVLAVAVGISDGVGFGANARAALMTRGLKEMIALGKVLGANPATLMGLSGCGDVILTCTDNQSRNRRFGLALAKGLNKEESLKQIGQVVEAVYNIQQLCHLARKHDVQLPIAEQVLQVMESQVSPKEAISELFKRL